MLSNKQLKEIAHKVVDIERKIEQTSLVECEKEFEEIIKGLDISDLLMIDEYIMEKKLLTK